MKPKLLIVGGTREAAMLASALVASGACEICTSLAGRTKSPSDIAGRVRVGGFGGVEGLLEYLRHEGFDAVVDATHPYATIMSSHAADACRRATLPRVQLWRPAWVAHADDQWTGVPSLTAAAAWLEQMNLPPNTTVFLSTGSKDLQAFQALTHLRFLVRTVDPQPIESNSSCPSPNGPTHPGNLINAEMIIGKGPFELAEEHALLEQYAVGVLVTKNSGGKATYAKLLAARNLRLPVIMIARPPAEVGPIVHSVDEALAWVREIFASR